MEKTIFRADDQLEGFESFTIKQPRDHEGEVVCTLVRMHGKQRNRPASLHVHGFNDYFFHAEAAEVFNQNGIDWYGIDLRKSGRSYLPHQTFNGLTNINQYFDDIHAALKLIKAEGATSVLLMGHSLGGLAVSLFAARFGSQGLFDAVFLNSPFFDQNKDIVTKKILIPLVSALAKVFPRMRVPGGFSKFYGPSLHKNDFGEWKYQLLWKPHIAPMVNAAWVRAVYLAHQEFWKGINILEPVLLMFPDCNVRGIKWKESFHYGDAVVNINDNRKGASCMQAPIIIKEIQQAKHDLFLSVETTRKEVYRAIFDWLNENTAINISQNNKKPEL